MAKIIKTNGDIVEVSPKNGSDFSLSELSEIVGGYIEIIHTLDRKNIIVLNEEGKILQLPINKKATEIAYGNNNMINDFIVGDVLLADLEQVK